MCKQKGKGEKDEGKGEKDGCTVGRNTGKS